MPKWTTLMIAVICLVAGLLICPIIPRSCIPEENEVKSLITKAGTILYVGGAGPGNYSNIPSAISAASSGDTIFVYSGTYNGDIIIDKPLSLIGENKANTFLRGGTAGRLIFIDSNNVNISGFNICTNSMSRRAIYVSIRDFIHIYDNDLINSEAGLKITGGKNHIVEYNLCEANEKGLEIKGDYDLIRNNTVKYNKEFGLLFDWSKNCTFRNNSFSGNNNSFYIRGSTQTEWSSHDIDNSNTIDGKPIVYRASVNDFVVPTNTEKIILANCHNVTIKDLAIHNDISSIQIAHSSDINIYNNNLTYTRNLVLPSFTDYAAIEILFSSIGSIYQNQITKQKGNGIYFLTSDKFNIYTNELSYNQMRGILIDNSDLNEIYYNTFRENEYYGVHIRTADSNKVFHNNFISNNNYNSYQASDNGNNEKWDDGPFGNHWSDWTSPDDLPPKGIVDNPYLIDGSAAWKDNYPMVDPFAGPILLTDNVLTAYEDQLYTVKYTALSPCEPASSLIWSMSTDALWISFDSNQTLYGIPKNEDVGSYWVNISVGDGVYSTFTNFTLTVVNANDDPEINTTNITKCWEDILFIVYFNATDIDPCGDYLIWGLDTNATFLSIGATSGILSGIPRNSDVGIYWVNVTVSDDNGSYDFTNFTLEVINVNDRPEIISAIPEISLFEDAVDNSISLTSLFGDEDGDPLVFGYKGNSNVTVSILSNNTVKLTPKRDWYGIETFTLFANDSALEVSAVININVTPVNDAPTNVVITLEDRDYYVNQAQPAWGTATDVDIIYGDVLSYSWFSNITGPIGNGSSLNLSLKAGWHNITLIVNDTAGTGSSAYAIIRILEPPVIGDDDDDTGDDDDDDAEVWDVDFDGLPDDWENDHFGGTDTYSGEDDPDNDNFTNLQEYQNGTDPLDPGSNPGVPDDDDEVEDSDWDDLPDAWEILHFGDIELYSANDDPDEDGFSNYQEYIAGTDPKDSGSYPLLDQDDDSRTEGLGSGFIVGILVVLAIIATIAVVVIIILIRRGQKEEPEEEEEDFEEDEDDEEVVMIETDDIEPEEEEEEYLEGELLPPDQDEEPLFEEESVEDTPLEEPELEMPTIPEEVFVQQEPAIYHEESSDVWSPEMVEKRTAGEAKSAVEMLKELGELKEKGLLTAEEYEKSKKRLLRRI